MVQGHSLNMCALFISAQPAALSVRYFTLCSCPCVCLCVCNRRTYPTLSMISDVFGSMLARLPLPCFHRLHSCAWPHGNSTALRPRLIGWSAQKKTRTPIGGNFRTRAHT